MRAALYCRVSTPGQRNTTSLPEQERLNREKAVALGWTVSEPHVYREVMGGEDLYRPCMDKLWDAIIHHEIDGVVVDVLDRLSRDEGDVGAFYHHADRYGVTVELASEDLDETENGRNLRTLMGMMGRMERADIKRRTQRGRRARAVAGKLFPASFPLYGYLFADDTHAAYVVDPETSWVVVFIFESVADGVPIRALCRELEARGIPTPGQVLVERGQLPKGKTASGVWRHGSVLRILHHPAYWGQHRIYRWRTTAEKIRPVTTGVTKKVRKMRERDADDLASVRVGAETCPPLIAPDLAARAQARLAVTKAQSAGNNPDPLATLWRGRIRYGHCGGRIHTAKVRGGPKRKYTCLDQDGVDRLTGERERCPGGAFSMQADVLDPAGWADVVTWLANPENVANLFASWEQESAQAEHSLSTRVEAVDAQIATLRDKMGRIAETIEDTSDRESRRVLQERLDTHATSIRNEEAKRAKLMEEAHTRAEHTQAQADMAAWARVVAEKAPTMTRAQQVATLRALGAEVTVWRGDYVHPDGWPQRYKIKLHFTGFTQDAGPVTLPAAHSTQAARLLVVTPTSLC
jgi:DNA invertase Pin-like site-specific DNA recombinase